MLDGIPEKVHVFRDHVLDVNEGLPDTVCKAPALQRVHRLGPVLVHVLGPCKNQLVTAEQAVHSLREALLQVHGYRRGAHLVLVVVVALVSGGIHGVKGPRPQPHVPQQGGHGRCLDAPVGKQEGILELGYLVRGFDLGDHAGVLGIHSPGLGNVQALGVDQVRRLLHRHRPRGHVDLYRRMDLYDLAGCGNVVKPFPILLHLLHDLAEVRGHLALGAFGLLSDPILHAILVLDLVAAGVARHHGLLDTDEVPRGNSLGSEGRVRLSVGEPVGFPEDPQVG